jgi:hypothetical protein
MFIRKLCIYIKFMKSMELIRKHQVNITNIFKIGALAFESLWPSG